jgi:hypothetical protein
MVGSSWWTVGVTFLALSNAACGIGHSCTDSGCQSGISVSVVPKSGVWQDGHYLLALALDDKTATCSFAVPDDLPAQGSPSSLDCGRAVHVELSSGPEDGVALHLALPDPDTLKINLSRDDSVILNESPMLHYRENQPNPGCVPICRNATVDFTTD